MKLIERYVQVIKDITEIFPKEVIHCYLFGSVAKKCIHENSDIDLCLILDNRNKKLEEELTRRAKVISGDIDLDIVFYSKEYYELHKDERGSFINKIIEGVKLW